MRFKALLANVIATTTSLCLVMAAGASPALAQMVSTRVEQGALKGAAKDGVGQFLGIPFAAPPVGKNRWRAPQPAASWKGVRKAERFGADCQQDIMGGNLGFGAWTPEYLITGPVSEDCLYLNVWTPAKRGSEKLPVLVWIYGGGFSTGGTSVPIYDGAALAAQGVVVVSLNYRVGVYGFLSHPELTAEANGSSGNYGLRDQIAGLEWVKKNIAAFGGDASRVTIAGQSAGEASVHDLILSPLAKGLFRNAIAQSGSGMGLNMPTRTAAEASGVRLQQAAGVASLAEMRKLTPAQLSDAARKPDPATNALGLRFAPIADGVVIPADPTRALASGEYNDTPILTGLTADEGSSMNPEYRPGDPDRYRALVRQRHGSSGDALLALYPATTPAVSAPALARDRGIASMIFWGEGRRATSKYPVYAYLFTHAEPGPDADKYGAFHSGEIPYVFNTLDKSPARDFVARDREVAKIMGRYWISFVKTGNPNASGLPTWPRLDDTARIMELGTVFAPRATMPQQQLDAFRTHVANGGALGLF